MEDKKVIARQLGREPRGLLSVEQRCRYGYPKVIKVYPLLKRGRASQASFEIFPTLFWLTCPIALQQISQLEYAGYIKKLEELIQKDKGFRDKYHEAHRSYIEERWQILKEEDKEFLKKNDLASSLLKRGIGGIKDFNRVKCLHLHYAHHLARDNIIGRFLEENFSLGECSPGNVYCTELVRKINLTTAKG